MNDEISYYEKDGKTYWNCGCVTYAKTVKGKKVFILDACTNTACRVIHVVHDASNVQDVPIVHIKSENVNPEDDNDGCLQEALQEVRKNETTET